MTNLDRDLANALERILSNEDGACHRLGLSPDIVNHWQGQVRGKAQADIVSLVRQVCKDNDIPLPAHGMASQAQEAVEAMLRAVDAFYRQTLTGA